MVNGFSKAVISCALVTLMMTFALPDTASAANDRFKEVLQRGTLRVGVQGALRPWSYRDSDGHLVGIEPDLAADVAETLGVKLELVQIETANRMEFLKQGNIDLIIGAMSDQPSRRKVVSMVQPYYWISGVNVLAKKGVISSWDDIRGKPVCAKQGSYFIDPVERTFGATFVSFPADAESKQAFRSGKCVAWVSDDTTIQQSIAAGEWDGYEMPLETKFLSYWSVGVPLEEGNGIWGRFMSGMVTYWQREGKLVELSAKWGVEPSPWLLDQHKRFEELLKKPE